MILTVAVLSLREGKAFSLEFQRGEGFEGLFVDISRKRWFYRGLRAKLGERACSADGREFVMVYRGRGFERLSRFLEFARPYKPTVIGWRR